MIKKTITNVFNKFNYNIIKQTCRGSEKYKIESNQNGLNLYNTPTGKYYLPSILKKDIVVNNIKNGNYFEPEIIEIAREFIKKGTDVLDVGANYGQMSVFFSKLAGSGTIYSFEAEPIVNDILRKNLEINNCKNSVVVSGAVYNEDGLKLVFPVPDFKRFDSYGSYGIDPNAKSGRTIETITIDSLNIQSTISFIKVDIQGCDLFALQGAKQTILKNKPAIIFEFEQQLQQEFKTSFNDYAEFVRSINYRFDRIIDDINFLILPNE